MRGFDAGKQIGLDYNFTTLPIDPDDEAAQILKDVKGTVPEPSQKKLEKFIEALRTIATDQSVSSVLNLGPDASQAEMLEALSALSEEDMERTSGAMTEALIEVCSGSPSKEQIEAMPMRLRGAFLGWLAGELVGPTQPTPASTPSLAGANGAGPVTA